MPHPVAPVPVPTSTPEEAWASAAPPWPSRPRRYRAVWWPAATRVHRWKAAFPVFEVGHRRAIAGWMTALTARRASAQEARRLYEDLAPPTVESALPSPLRYARRP